MSWIVEATVSFFLLLGTSFVVIGSFGLWRMPHIFMRMHGPTKATTMGLSCVVGACIVYHTYTQGHLVLKEAAISLFLFITAPIVGHLLSKAALARRQGGRR